MSSDFLASEPHPWRVDWKAIWPVLALGVVLRLILLILNLDHTERFLTTDSALYEALARNFEAAYLRLEGPQIGNGLFRPPLYPLFIRAVYEVFGTSVIAVIGVQVVVSMIAIVLTVTLGTVLFDSSAARWAATLVAVDPILVIYTNALLAETLYVTLVILTILVWIRALGRGSSAGMIAAGALLGAGVLVRPTGLYLPILLIPIGWLIARHRWQRLVALSLSLLIGAALSLGSWMFRNYVITGIPVVSTTEGVNLLGNRAEDAMLEQGGRSLTNVRAEIARRLDARVPESWGALSGPEREARVDRARRDLAFEIILENPLGYVRSTVKGTAYLMLGPGRESLLRVLGADEPTEIDQPAVRALLLLEFALLALLYIGVMVGTVVLIRKRAWRHLLVIYGLLVYFVILSAGPEANSRYRAPMVPLLAMMAGFGFSYLLRWIQSRRAHQPDG